MITKNKISRQAKAVLDLYNTLPKETRVEIKKMILEDELSFEEVEKSSDLTELSEKSLEELWDTPENEHWDEFFKQKGYV
ncbi:hypothetical protein [Rhodohalobacter sp.]|uniref:hypothetical protein n=1 Tax=Rhodohalobacter sp. TaxID=1974210 RepID=UPI002ACE7B1F|nr:hypothetical protein [Rhodohalobacter sp.]MDZ7757412.1 hypothetical protein [Rhodohalobacter sp.]